MSTLVENTMGMIPDMFLGILVEEPIGIPPIGIFDMFEVSMVADVGVGPVLTTVVASCIV